MNYNESLDFIHSLRKFKKKAEFVNIKKVLGVLGNPQDNLEYVHIAGTNGKGSVSSYLAEILKTSGKKVGLFTSPFIVDFRERFQINNEYISQNDLVLYVQKVKQVLEKESLELSEFEFITVIAFLYFYDNNCDIVVLETGIGGRLDATNVIKKPKVAVITKIDIDHSDILGDTLEKITAEKCGIIKRNINVVTSALQCDVSKKQIEKICKENSAVLHYNNVDRIENEKITLGGNSFTYKNEVYKTKLIGEHQFDNSMLAVATAKIIGVNKEDIILGLSNAVLPARVEVVSENPVVIIDGAHNPSGVNALKKTLDELFVTDFYAVVAMMQDKEIDEALKFILPNAEKCFVTDLPGNLRALPKEELKTVALKYCKDTEVINIEDVFQLKEKNKPIVIFGSLYFASFIRNFFRQ